MLINVRALAASIAVSALVGGHVPSVTPGIRSLAFAAANLTDFKGVEDLKTLFNHDAGKVRLVLLVSPT